MSPGWNECTALSSLYNIYYQLPISSSPLLLSDSPVKSTKPSLAVTLPRDLMSGLVVFLVALPLCLGVALASNAPLISGLVSGIIGGVVVGILSGSQTSVSGPAAGLTAVVAAQIVAFGSFPAFLFAVFVAGLMQIGMGIAKAGGLAAFFPSSVIKGLLAAIGVILILKQFPHVLGFDADAFSLACKAKGLNCLTMLQEMFQHLHLGASIIGVLSIAFLMFWDRNMSLKKSPVPAPLLVVLLGVGLGLLFRRFGDGWAIGTHQLVQVPVAESMNHFLSFLTLPDFTQWSNPRIYSAAATIAIVASLETLLNLQAVDKIDPYQRSSPPSRELWAQGAGNLLAGLTGGLPITSVIVRSSVNINAGGRTKLAAVFHGLLLFICILFLAETLNLIPLSCLAAILIVTGIKLASPTLVKQMWAGGTYQFIPFVVTVVAIVISDLLVGVLIGLGVALSFILWSNMRRPVHTIIEKHLGGDVIKIDLANQVSFLNRAALDHALHSIEPGSHVLFDATHTNYIDPDILDLIRDFKNEVAPARDVEVSLVGFRPRYRLRDQIQYVDYSTRELQDAITPAQVLDILKQGHERFRTGQQLTRDFGRQVTATARSEHPLAVVLSCVDSRTPTELIFDLGVGDIYSVRIAGTVLSRKVLGSIEYGCSIAGAKLIVVMGHTRCGVMNAAVESVCAPATSTINTLSSNFGLIVDDIRQSISKDDCAGYSADTLHTVVDAISHKNVRRVTQALLNDCPLLAQLVSMQKLAIVGAMYDVTTGTITFGELIEG